MFKKLLLVLGGGALLLVGGCVVMLFWAQQSGSKLQAKFFEAVDSGDPQQVLNLCDPALQKQIDAPVLGAWINEVRAKLGKFKGLSATKFSTNMKATSEGTLTESSGTVEFEHGEASSDLAFRNDLLTAFAINSDKIAGSWFKGPTDSKLYQERAEKFIRAFFSGDAAATRALVHENLKSQVDEAKMKELITGVVEVAGPVKNVKFRDEKFTDQDGKQNLTLNFDLDCEKRPATAAIKIQFIDMQGHILGFDFQEKTP